MLRALRTAALGMQGQQMNVDNIANNLANVNTTGYKKSSIEFQDLLYETVESGSSISMEGNEKPGSIQIGSGNKPVSTYRTFSQGSITETSNPLDMAINGQGFFQVLQPDGSIAFSRDGAFRINAQGNLVNSMGLQMYPEMNFPEGVTSVNISQDGIISVLLDGETMADEIGQVELAGFMNPGGLKAIGGNLFVATDSSGDPSFGIPGEDRFGSLEQGYLEKSNVDVVSEMINLIVSQRAYEINSKAVKTADELMSLTNNIKR